MKSLIIAAILLFSHSLMAQNKILDTIVVRYTAQNLKFNYKQLIIPSVLIGYGLLGLNSDQIKDYDLGIQDEVTENIDKNLVLMMF